MNILIINGPNLNMLGIREPQIYGSQTYRDLCNFLKQLAKIKKIKIKIFQSNSESKIIDIIQKAYQKYDGLVINAGAYSHYSYAIADAIRAISINAVEVHLTDIKRREDFRKKSVFENVCLASFSGKGFLSYKEAIEYLMGV